MIIGDKRLDVIHNIARAANDRDFTAKTEIGDPMMTSEEKLALVEAFWQKQDRFKTKVDGVLGRELLQVLTKALVGSTKVTGLEKLHELPRGGAIVTANHFNQIDALAVNCLAQKAHRRMDIVIEETNLKLPGFFSYIMNNMGSIPLTQSPNYLGREFIQHLSRAFNQDHWVLIFPEQEMWWNYRKPRKPQRGAYYFAAKCNVPVISTFVEIQTLPKAEKKNEHFQQTRYVLHVLGVLYPDPTKPVSENASRMMEEDYQLKVQAYEEVYHKKLDYDFTSWDIAGWRGE
ncbi:1-acyl-sn-glycerol-3-phosphate acyltransferase [Lactobacillus nasalidis]|uniref:1-acyl-sn-glycerol-3-phosphate acyltransferase n=1 Tax=Lactobacillus nasalidis TaxID=2797258 RepID=A0ABQ3W2J0_9LACO|nr:1-acyl-sn-glycerol-3-phosphate acyltransferase [Lactobacillus nasalidis]GHV98375.1 1-acyl-sn-glycerol-3-phosphate acyltransferase [Lactobacillus nasalidis]GHV99533.1 1-acyl-sn-glycerol-3-phosphate acyltransferase [Lactobacillus nasalidis]GHW00503.1 1-acyl-sn-glycerol-3-phosphate acyltransferase [Lactobacillus nasalidis]